VIKAIFALWALAFAGALLLHSPEPPRVMCDNEPICVAGDRLALLDEAHR
jgi:hypothetical protein